MSKSIAQLEAEYEQACDKLISWEPGIPIVLIVEEMKLAAATLAAARTAQQEQGEEEQVAEVISSLVLPLDGENNKEVVLLASDAAFILKALKAAGFTLSRTRPAEPPPAPEPASAPQEPVRLGLQGLWRCPCCMARPDYIERVP